MARKSVVNSLIEKLVPLVDDVSAFFKAYTRRLDAETKNIESLMAQTEQLQKHLMKLEPPAPKMVSPDNGLSKIFGGDSKQG